MIWAQRRILAGATGVQSGFCPICGKKAIRQRRFEIAKDRRKMTAEEQKLAYSVAREVAADWAREQVFHAKCEKDTFHLSMYRHGPNYEDREKWRQLILDQWDDPTAYNRHRSELKRKSL